MAKHYSQTYWIDYQKTSFMAKMTLFVFSFLYLLLLLVAKSFRHEEAFYHWKLEEEIEFIA